MIAVNRAVRSVSRKGALRVLTLRRSLSSPPPTSTCVVRGNPYWWSSTITFSPSHRPTIARFQSSIVAVEEEHLDLFQPMGDLFESKLKSGAVGENLVGKWASIRRVFGPSANAQGLLTCGGEELARQASFDPDYETAREWIRSRAIGPAVLSPVLISGLVGALVEAALPQTVPLSSSMNHYLPLIVGVEVCAKIEVDAVMEGKRENCVGNENVDGGYEISLTTQVVRVQDDAIVSEGTHRVWMPGYLTM